MGNRANIYLIDRTANEVIPNAAPRGIYLYTHWNGSDWPEALRRALSNGHSRIGDPSYLARIIVSNVFADIHGQESGGGISTELTDNSHPIIVCDLAANLVAFAEEGNEIDRNKWYGKQSFSAYIAQEQADYPALTPII